MRIGRLCGKSNSLRRKCCRIAGSRENLQYAKFENKPKKKRYKYLDVGGVREVPSYSICLVQPSPLISK
jgi:hypothetical protein